MTETAPNPLNIRWLGKVSYKDALAVQKALFNKGSENYLLLLEHPHVFTLGVRGDTSNILVNPSDIGADLIKTNRGGDVTYHGPGQLVGYPILNLAGKRGGGMADTVAYVNSVEDLIIETLAHLGLKNCGRLDQYPGVWVNPNSENPRKIAAVGVRLTRGRTMHGFALNIEPDMTYFDSIIPCGIKDKKVTSLSKEGIAVPMAEVVEVIAELASKQWGNGNSKRMDVSWRASQSELSPFSKGEGPGELPKPAGECASDIPQPVTIGRKSIKQRRAEIAIGRKPEWMRVKANMGSEYRELKRSIRSLELTTVCEEAGCPNIFECWGQGTATFMALGERCTRACGFCLVDTRKPQAVDHDEPQRIAKAVNQMSLEYAVITMVARDDLQDGGANHIREVINEVRSLNPQTSVEVLISDLKGNPDDLQTVFSAKPDVMNHNIETVPRLQRQVRPSAGYARSLAVLALAKEAGLVVKSSIMVGLGETEQEMFDTLKDLKEIGVDIVTIGQYLRPTMNHLPVQRWWTPEEFNELKTIGETLGIPHVESSPLTRSSYHAKEAETLAKNKAHSLTTSGSQ